jgi:hypothetical protein
MMNWKGFRRKRKWPNFRILPQHSLEGTEENMKTSVRIAGLLAEISTRDIPQTR